MDQPCHCSQSLPESTYARYFLSRMARPETQTGSETKLSDAWVYIMLHTVPPTMRGKRWSYDFTSDSSI